MNIEKEEHFKTGEVPHKISPNYMLYMGVYIWIPPHLSSSVYFAEHSAVV